MIRAPPDGPGAPSPPSGVAGGFRRPRGPPRGGGLPSMRGDEGDPRGGPSRRRGSRGGGHRASGTGGAAARGPHGQMATAITPTSLQKTLNPGPPPPARRPGARRPPPAFYLANGSELPGSMTSGSSGDP